jgi:hypothetical protein
MMDAFDRSWPWADKPPESLLTISADLHRAVMDSLRRTGAIEAAARVDRER